MKQEGILVPRTLRSVFGVLISCALLLEAPFVLASNEKKNQGAKVSSKNVNHLHSDKSRKPALEEIQFDGTGIGANESLALADAYQNAMSALLKEHLSITYSFDEEIRHSGSKLIQNSKFHANVGSIKIEGIRTISVTKRFINQGVIEVRARYAIDKSSLERAKLRQTAINNFGSRKSEPNLSTSIVESSEPAGLRRASIVVETKPSGALVTIDDAISLPSPVRLHQYLDPGEHKVLIDHPNYLPIEAVIFAKPGGTVSIRETLMRAAVEMSFESVPSGAVLQIDGKVVGVKPISVNLEVGREIDLRIQHLDTRPLVKKLTVQREPKKQSLRAILEYHPTNLLVVGPEVAGQYLVYQNKKSSEIQKGKSIQVDPGAVKVCFRPLAKEVQKSVQCGSECCKSVDLQPGRQNLVSFHRELQPANRVSKLREITRDEIKDVEEVESSDQSDNSQIERGNFGDSTQFQFPELNFNPVLSGLDRHKVGDNLSQKTVQIEA